MDNELKQCLIGSIYYPGYDSVTYMSIFNFKLPILNNVMYVGEMIKDSLQNYTIRKDNILHNVTVTNEFGVTLNAIGFVSEILIVHDPRLDYDDLHFYFKKKNV